MKRTECGSNKRSNVLRGAAALLAAVLLLMPSSGCGLRKGTVMWFEHSTKKILHGYENASGHAEYMLFLGGNEYEGCQLAVRFPEDHGEFTLSASAPMKDGSAAAELSVEIYEEHYIPVTMSAPFLAVSPEEDGRAEEYPDALAPHSAPMYVPANTTQPFYVLVHAGREAAPGEYEVVLTARDGEKVLGEARLTVHVWGFVLPDTPAMAAVSDVSRYSMAKATDPNMDGDEAQRLYEIYYEFALEHHVSPYTLPYDVLDERADKYLDDPRVTGFRVKYGDNSYLRAVAEKLSQKPEWLKKAYFYFLDEPGDEDRYMDLVKLSRHLLEIFPEARIVSPFFVNPDMYLGNDALEYCFGSVNIWCLKLFCFDRERPENIYTNKQIKKLAPIADRLAERRAMGEDVWTYVCWEPGEPYLNLYINMQGMQHRLIFWQNYMLGANGFLYWSSNYWDRVNDPWESGATVNDLSPFVYGDGSLMYNGNKVGVDGPCSSLRLEAVRDGVDDFTYLSMLEDSGMPRGEVLKLVGRLTAGLTEYTLSDDMLYKARYTMGNLLEKASG